MKNKYDLIVIGGGVLGTFHAYHALRKGLKVALIEKNSIPKGATVRNFGQVVPSGMNSKWQSYGRKSLNIYKEIQSQFDISVRQEGSVYIASNEEEVQLLDELSQINKMNEYPSRMLTKKECLEAYPGLKESYVKAGLFFPEEIKVEPLTMINRVHAYLKSEGLHLFLKTKAVHCEDIPQGVMVITAGDKNFIATKVIICNGSDFETLYPLLFEKSPLAVSKLQMMQTKPQPNYKLNSSILTGLSIRRYEAFEECPSYAAIKSKENPDSFEKKWGIHILFKQAIDGSVIIGDSHEYADAAQKDDLDFSMKAEIDEFIIEEAKKIFDLPTYEIQHRWYGMYSQCKQGDIYQHTIDKNIHIVTGIGGKGMTGSAGFSQYNIKTIFNF